MTPVWHERYALQPTGRTNSGMSIRGVLRKVPDIILTKPSSSAVSSRLHKGLGIHD